MEHLAYLASATRRVTERFRYDTRGNVAILFGLSLLPLTGMVGVALDYNRATEFRGYMHRESDVAALAIAAADTPNADGVIAALKSRVGDYWGSGSTMVKNVAVKTEWVSSSVFNLTISADVKTTFTSIVPGVKDLKVGVTTAVKRRPPEYQWSLPNVKNLSYEAADYNRISVYCYDDTKKDEANKGRRLETLRAIADNGGTDYSRVGLPECKAGETLSYQLRNVRNSRTNPSNWDRKRAEHYIYFTDMTIDKDTRVMTHSVSGGREDENGKITPINVTSPSIVETIVCTPNLDCKTKATGGVLPNDNVGSHDPAKATVGCMEGKSMYYGWEDRPPSAGSSDKDFNDIRIQASCPTRIKTVEKEVRIIR